MAFSLVSMLLFTLWFALTLEPPYVVQPPNPRMDFLLARAPLDENILVCEVWGKVSMKEAYLGYVLRLWPFLETVLIMRRARN
ncbi:hypothetical protein KEJ47_10275 [Candidatus Bathyarchaeota archaeon]|nr:hypothetical protein [Candidatus Bathyarchaeota archaeon]